MLDPAIWIPWLRRITRYSLLILPSRSRKHTFRVIPQMELYLLLIDNPSISAELFSDSAPYTILAQKVVFGSFPDLQMKEYDDLEVR